MAPSLRSNTHVVVIVAAAAMLLTVSGFTCPDEDTPLVYPHWSTCLFPARYYGAEVYELAARNASTGAALGSLAPEWDESNSTYYVRLSDEGARYIFTHGPTFEFRISVAQSQDVLIVNQDTGRILSWRKEGEDEYFLVEEESGNATLQFVAADDVPLVCPRIANARCQAFNIFVYGDTSRGLSPYVEDGVMYFTQGSNTLPFVLRRTSTTSVSARKAVLAARA